MSGSCQERTVYLCLRKDHSRTPAERDEQERGWVFEPHTHGKAMELSVHLEMSVSPIVLRHVEGELHWLFGFEDQATVLVVLDT